MNARGPCLKPEDLTRAALDPAQRRFLGHLSSCAHCALKLADINRLFQIARALPNGEPTEERANTILAEVLAADISRPSRSGLFVKFSAAAAVFLLLMTGLFALFLMPSKEKGPPRPAEIHRGTVSPHLDASFNLVSSQPDEIVRLTDGAVTVNVAKLSKGERFRIAVKDAEIEVKGTAFDVVAEDDRLSSVWVMSGEVAVRAIGHKEVILHPGERWPESNAAAEAVDEKTIGPIEERSPQKTLQKTRTPHPLAASIQDEAPPVPTTDERAESPVEEAFNKGWQAYKAERWDEAVEYFERSYAADPGSGFAEDSLFWKAVVHDRRGESARAEAALQLFLDTYPKAHRAGEAQAMLGWKLLQSGDLKKSEALFQQARLDSSPKVQKSAEQGLLEIKKK
jgi:tetratricopeptide (TPR) repeat protein